jgi:hypothetical protein
MSQAMELSTTGNDRIKPGANMSPFEQSELEIADLYTEAMNWADGEPVTSQEAHDEVERLMGLFNDAMKLAEERRVEEIAPYKAATDEAQARWNTLIGKNKSITGKAHMALDALKKVVEPFRIERKRIKDEEARRIREEAEAAERAAQQAFQQTNVSDLAEREEAERLAAHAAALNKQANKADKAAETKTGLRTYWDVEVTDNRALASHYWKTRPADVDAFFEGLAKSDVHGGARTIPGCKITEQKRV